jgi:15-cis-phytoene synthase
MKTADGPSPDSLVGGPGDGLGEVAKAWQPEHYWAALLAPEPVRAGLSALAAFAGELGRIPHLVKEPMMGEIRLQWWRDALQDPATQHPVAAAVQSATSRFNLPFQMLMAMTEARAFDLYPDPMTDEAAYHGYLDKTVGAVFAMGLKVSGADGPAALADHAGRAFGAARLLAQLPWWVSKGRVPLPAGWVADAGFQVDNWQAALPQAAHRLVDRVATEIEADADAARRLSRELSRAQRVPLLPLATISPYLAAIRKCPEPMRREPAVGPLSRIGRIAWAHGVGL